MLSHLVFQSLFMFIHFGSVPFYLGTPNLSFIISFFESMSGLTTTGATIIQNLDTTSKSILLWRAMLQWLGGIGIIVIAIAIFPILKIGGMQLLQTEFSSKEEKILPRTTKIARDRRTQCQRHRVPQALGAAHHAWLDRHPLLRDGLPHGLESPAA